MATAIHEVNEQGCLVLTCMPPSRWSLAGVLAQHEHAAQLLAALVAFEAAHPDGPSSAIERVGYCAMLDGVRGLLTMAYAAVRQRELEISERGELVAAREVCSECGAGSERCRNARVKCCPDCAHGWK